MRLSSANHPAQLSVGRARSANLRLAARTNPAEIVHPGGPLSRLLHALICIVPTLIAMTSGARAAAQAEDAPATTGTGRVVYDAGFYGAFAPRTALDMINQTPGFVLDKGDDQQRGFAGAVGNVLIDGERLSAKSQSLTDVLERVPAAEVQRIEILRGAEVAGDASGAAVLANVVRTRNANSGTWDAGTEVTNEKHPVPVGHFAWSGRDDATQYSVGANVYSHDHLSPFVREVTDGSGEPLAERRGATPHEQGQYTLNGQLAMPAGDGKLTFTGQTEYFTYSEDWWQNTTAADGTPIDSDQAPYDENTRSAEIGINWQRPLAGWDMELVGLATRRQYGSAVTSTHSLDDVVQIATTQHVDQDSGESIVRGTFRRGIGAGRLEAGGEIAVNTLDGSSDLNVDVGAGPTPVSVPNANLSVKETRAEGFASYATPLDADWSFDARLAAETSRLQFTGDTEQSVALTYLKPRLQFTRRFGPHQLQFRVYRDVGQLDFTDFVTTSQLVDNVIHGGNPDLRPQTAWSLEVDADFRFAGDAALRVRGFRQYLDDVVDLIPVGTPGAQFDAPGNIGKGSLLGVETSLRLPLKKVLPGGSFTLGGKLQDSRVTDPVTGETRSISNFIENQVTAELRQDATAAKLAWGLYFQGYSPTVNYRLREVDNYRQVRRLDAYIESTVIDGFKLKLTAYNILGDTERRDRNFYSPDRTGDPALGELTHFRPGTWWLLSVSSSF
jgi:hypothetical protein